MEYGHMGIDCSQFRAHRADGIRARPADYDGPTGLEAKNPDLRSRAIPNTV